MRQGSVYAAKIKRLFNKLRRDYGRPDEGERTEPVEQTILAILSRDASDVRGAKALARLRAATVDLNDLRVTTMPDIAETIGADYPGATARARDIRDALTDIFNRESVLNLDFLRERTRREARQYLESLRGVDGYTAASVMLWSLGGHAIPVDHQLLEVLRRKELVADRADRAEVQAFLEHHISAADAQAFTTVMHRYAAAHASRSVAGRGDGRTRSREKAKAKTTASKGGAKPRKRSRTPAKKTAAAARKSKSPSRRSAPKAARSGARGKTTASATQKSKRRAAGASRRKTGTR